MVARRLRRGVFPPSVHFKANSTFSTSLRCLVITTRVQWHAARLRIRKLITHFEKSIVTSFNLHRPKAINNAYLSTHSFSLLVAIRLLLSPLPPLIQSTRSFAKCWQTDDRPTDSTMLLQSLLIWSSQSRSPYNSKMILSPNIDQAGSYCL